MAAYADQPCSNCGWKYPGFHVCVANPSTEVQPVKRPKRGPMSDEHRQKISEGQLRRHIERREERADER